jgi:hypothetical protein
MYIPSTLAARKDFSYLEHTVAARDWGMCRRNAFTIAGNPFASMPHAIQPFGARQMRRQKFSSNTHVFPFFGVTFF